jgi:hypothetical protein
MMGLSAEGLAGIQGQQKFLRMAEKPATLLGSLQLALTGWHKAANHLFLLRIPGQG